MDEQILQQLFAELISSIEPLETRHAALLQLLKSKGVVTDEELAPFLNQAGNTSDIRWRAVQLRSAALISSALRPSSKEKAKAGEPNTSATAPEPAEKTGQAEAQSAKREKTAEKEPDQPGKSQVQAGEGDARKAQTTEARDQKPDKEQPSEEDLRESKLSNPPLIQKNKDKESDKDRGSGKDKDKENEQGSGESIDATSGSRHSAAEKPESEAA
jgi:hypothetical protein